MRRPPRAGQRPAFVAVLEHNAGVTSVVIVGGGPGGYEAAHVAAQLGASVTLVDSDGMGGSAVLTDCVPSKALIAVADGARATADNAELGVLVNGVPVDRDQVGVDLAAVNERIQRLAQAQSLDVAGPSVIQASEVYREYYALLQGYSSGGIFVLYALFQQPDAFQRYISGSAILLPS